MVKKYDQFAYAAKDRKGRRYSDIQTETHTNTDRAQWTDGGRQRDKQRDRDRQRGTEAIMW